MVLDLTEFREVFFDEVAEHLAIIQRCLREIARGNVGAHVIAEAYRCAHSIKGGSATFGFDEMRDRAGSLAGVLDLAREGRLVLDAAALDTCCDAQATLAAQLAARRCGTQVCGVAVQTPALGACVEHDGGEPEASAGGAAGRIETAVVNLQQTAAHMQQMMTRLEQMSREHAELADCAASMALQFERQMAELLKDPALADRSSVPAMGLGRAGHARRGEGAPLPKVKAAGTGRRSLEQEWEEI
ncbi:MAG TPA: Hpt domain-containing protein [Aromatoleum sp.]|uniref:Hpt domain-containing protein n=1 Tax=Aromatoleum sp. TaxID=2307007 RepID=UPI002B45F79F|nr:Hpt domain-containing protein [Aromatoleum sp.]HJV25715.1 Hpt domain-containing protein [Aromatoleum sp.]